MRIATIINLKGGVGKTTTTVNMAATLANLGKRVLCIDADPQANLTRFYGLDGDKCLTLDDLLKGYSAHIDDYIYDTAYDGVSIIPASLGLADCDIAAAQGCAHIRIIKQAAEAAAEVEPLDFVLIDCPPGFTAASVGALYAADDVIIPTTVDINAIDGTREILKQIDGARQVNPRIRAMVLLTMVSTSQIDRAGEEMLRKSGLPVLETPIRKSAKVPEAMFARKPLTEYSPHCIAAKTYDLLIVELAAEYGWEVINHGKVKI